jgi:hypothetical protein
VPDEVSAGGGIADTAVEVDRCLRVCDDRINRLMARQGVSRRPVCRLYRRERTSPSGLLFRRIVTGA